MVYIFSHSFRNNKRFAVNSLNKPVGQTAMFTLELLLLRIKRQLFTHKDLFFFSNLSHVFQDALSYLNKPDKDKHYIQ